VRDAASLSLAAIDHRDRVLFEAPLQSDRATLTSLLQVARSALEALPHDAGARHASELRTAAVDALRGDDAAKLSVLEYLARQPASLPPMAAGANDPRELAQDLGAELLPELLPLRTHPDTALRLALVQALTKQPAHEADALLMDLAGDREPAVRGSALTELAARTISDVPSWVERLSTAALTEPAFWLRQRAVRVLARLSSQAATTALVRVLSTDAYAVVRESAAAALAGRDSGLVGKALTSALRDPEVRVCAAAARALRQSGGEALRAARSDATLSAAMRELLSR
jgi:HEAT repeat protein